MTIPSEATPSRRRALLKIILVGVVMVVVVAGVFVMKSPSGTQWSAELVWPASQWWHVGPFLVYGSHSETSKVVFSYQVGPLMIRKHEPWIPPLVLSGYLSVEQTSDSVEVQVPLRPPSETNSLEMK